MKKEPQIFVKFVVTFVDRNDRLVLRDYYGTLFQSGRLKIYNPAYKVKDCGRKHFFNIDVPMWSKYETSEEDVNEAFITVGVKQRFDGFDYWQIDQDFTPITTKVYSHVKIGNKYERLVSIDFTGAKRMKVTTTERTFTLSVNAPTCNN